MSPVSLDYGSSTADPWWPVARFMCAAVITHALMSAVLSATLLGRNAQFPFSSTGPGTVDEVLIVAVCIALAIGGWLARRGRPVGRTAIQVLEPTLVSLSVVRSGLTMWTFIQQWNNSYMFVLLGELAMGLLLEAFPSALFWLFFRRVEVRALFTAG